MANPSYCVDTLESEREKQVGLYPCRKNRTHPGWHQEFKLRNHRDISIERSNSDCLDYNHRKILFYSCKFNQENQYFRYDLNTQMIYCGSKRLNQCMDVDMRTKLLIYGPCDEKKLTQKWIWGFVNETMLNDWLGFGKPILDPMEIEDLTGDLKKKFEYVWKRIS